MKKILTLWLIFFPSYLYAIEICERTGKIGRFDESTGMLYELNELDINNIVNQEYSIVDNLLNKIPIPPPDIVEWIEDELASNDLNRELKVTEYDSYTMYESRRRLENMSRWLFIINSPFVVDDKEGKDKRNYLDMKHLDWINYISEINDYGNIKIIFDLYEDQIIKPKPDDHNLLLSMILCGRKANEMNIQIARFFLQYD